MSYQKPNYTQVPNEFFDAQIAEIDSMSELKVTLAVMRQTFGYHRDSKWLTVSRLMALTGLSKPSVVDGIKRALARGTILRWEENGKNYFSIAVKEADPRGKDSLPEPVKNLNPRKETEPSSSSLRSEEAISQGSTAPEKLRTQPKERFPKKPVPEEWPGDDSPIPERQSYFIAYLARRLKERDLVRDKPITPSYRKQFVGNVAAHLKNGATRARILLAIDHVVYRWPEERISFAQGWDSTEPAPKPDLKIVGGSSWAGRSPEPRRRKKKEI